MLWRRLRPQQGQLRKSRHDSNLGCTIIRANGRSPRGRASALSASGRRRAGLRFRDSATCSALLRHRHARDRLEIANASPGQSGHRRRGRRRRDDRSGNEAAAPLIICVRCPTAQPRLTAHYGRTGSRSRCRTGRRMAAVPPRCHRSSSERVSTVRPKCKDLPL
jgi:hypothetical protein